MPGRLTVGQRTLNPSILVQIQAGQPNIFLAISVSFLYPQSGSELRYNHSYENIIDEGG